MKWEGDVAIIPTLPIEYKLYKCMQYLKIDPNKDYTDNEINSMYELLKGFNALDGWEFPNERSLI